jgi:MYXO-CTERM domain-containing protein
MRAVTPRRSLLACGIALACALTPVISAAAPTEPGSLVNPLLAPYNCEFCHTFGNPAAQLAEPPYAPFNTWQGSLMANSARDPVFWAGVAVAADDMPGETEACVRCHSPRAFLEGNGAATSMDQLTVDQQQGVECELCHRAVDDGVTPPGNAQYTVDDVVVGTNVPRRGPWDYTDGVPEPPHTWIADPYIGTSRLCGTCHDVTTPAERVDDDGNGLGVSFNEQRTYSEWLGSAYAEPGAGFRSCQDCHMPAVEDMNGCTAHLNQYSHPIGGRRHDLVGANKFMVELLKAEYGSAGQNVIADVAFEDSIERMEELLATSATLDVQAPREVDLTVGLSDIAVTVTNQTGHKLPSGYSEGRVMWLEVVAEYAGEVVYTSGAWDQAAGTIEADPQLRTYQGIAEDFADGTTFHLLRNNHWVIDSRIPPLGLQPNLETDPVGDRYTLLPDGTWPNYDTHTYAFAAAPEIADATPGDTTDDELSLTVRLRYLVNTPEYIAFLGEAGGMAGADVAATFEAAGGAPPLTLVESTTPIQIVAFGTMAGTTGDGSTTASDPDTTAGPGATGDSTSTSGGTMPSTTMPDPATTASGTDAGSTGGDPPSDGGGDGCGCTTDRKAPAGAALLPLLLVALRRRRPRGCGSSACSRPTRAGDRTRPRSSAS